MLSKRMKITIIGCFALSAWLLIAALWVFFGREEHATGWLLLSGALSAQALASLAVLVGLRRPPP